MLGFLIFNQIDSMKEGYNSDKHRCTYWKRNSYIYAINPMLEIPEGKSIIKNPECDRTEPMEIQEIYGSGVGWLCWKCLRWEKSKGGEYINLKKMKIIDGVLKRY